MNFDVALKLFKKYGFNSVNDLPYLSIYNDKIGVSFRYVDSSYGTIERTTFFEELEELEHFLKLYRKYVDNGGSIHMALDNYQVLFPNVIYVKDEKLMLNDEVLKGVKNKVDLTKLEKLKIVAKNLLSYYLDISYRQVKHINNVGLLKNDLLKKEKELQDVIRIIKKKKITGSIDIVKEESFKYDDSLYSTYEDYLNKAITEEQLVSLISSLWNLNKKLELSRDYYNSINVCRDIAEQMRLLDIKIDYVKSLKGKNLLLVNINSNLKQIENNYIREKISDSYVEEEREKVKRKYSLYDKISIYHLDDYLKEAYLYENYEYVASKYTLEDNKQLSKNEIISHLRNAYQLLIVEEKRVLTLFNSKYRNIFELILEIPDFNEWAPRKMARYLEGIESVSRFKEECIDELCTRLVQEVNRTIREKYFDDINFKSFKFFVADMIKLLVILKNINDKMVLDGDIKLYMDFKNISSLKNKYVYYLADNINSIIGNARTKKNVIGVFKILKGTPVLYSPKTLDFGDLYDKSSKVFRELNNNKVGLVIDINDVIVMRDRKLTDVYYYKNNIETINGITVVTGVKYYNKLGYCNFTIYKK